MRKAPLLILLILPSFLSAQDELRSSADLTWPLENAGASARASALGSSYVAVPGDVNSIFFNPAGLAELSHSQVALHHNQWISNIRQETIAFAQPFYPMGTLGFAFHLVEYGSIEARDTQGDLVGTSHPRLYQSTIAWGQRGWKGLSLGASLKGSLQALDGSYYTAISTDLGGLLTLNSHWRLGASYNNWGHYVRNYLLASVARFGVSYNSTLGNDHHLLISNTLALEPSGIHRMSIGVEDFWKERVAIRVGYQLDLNDNPLDGFYGLTTGAGLRLKPIMLDYAFQPYGELGSAHRISITYDLAQGDSPNTKSSSTYTATPTETLTTTPTPTSTYTPIATSTSTTTTNPTHRSPAQKTSPWIPGTNANDIAPRENLKLYFQLPDEATAPAGPVIISPVTQADIEAHQAKIAVDASDANTWMELGRLYYSTGQKELAIQCFEQVLRLKPDELKLKKWLQSYNSSIK